MGIQDTSYIDRGRTSEKLSHSLKSVNLLGNQRIPEERNIENGQGLCYTPEGARGAPEWPLCCPCWIRENIFSRPSLSVNRVMPHGRGR